jgi:hypothetical protein
MPIIFVKCKYFLLFNFFTLELLQGRPFNPLPAQKPLFMRFLSAEPFLAASIPAFFNIPRHRPFPLTFPSF